MSRSCSIRSSEDFLIDGALWGGAACWATILNANFLSFNMSSTIAWSAVWSVYGPGMFQDEGVNPAAGSRVLQWGPGLLFASTPWSGSFSMTPAAWATAHTTHFTRVGDHYLLVSNLYFSTGRAERVSSPALAYYTLVRSASVVVFLHVPPMRGGLIAHWVTG